MLRDRVQIYGHDSIAQQIFVNIIKDLSYLQRLTLISLKLVNGPKWSVTQFVRECKTCSKNRTLVDNKIVGHSDVVRTSPVGGAPTTSSLSTQHLA